MKILLAFSKTIDKKFKNPSMVYLNRSCDQSYNLLPRQCMRQMRTCNIKFMTKINTSQIAMNLSD